MSLNKFTTSTDYLSKQYLNVGCNDIKSTTLSVSNSEVKGSISGVYSPVITSLDGSIVANIKAVYTIVGNNDDAIFDCNFTCEIVVATSITTYIIVLPLPAGYQTNQTDQSCAVGAIHTRGHNNNYTAYSINQPLGGTVIAIFFDTNNFPDAIPIGVGENYISCNVKSSVAKI